MKKIVILGPSGAGKTTLAHGLGHTLKIKVFHLDRLFWQRGWKRKTWYERVEIVEQLIQQENTWIIEGSYLASFQPALQEADTIIFLDMAPLVCAIRVIKRHLTSTDQVRRRDIPEGCADRLTISHLWKVLTFTFHDRRKIKHCLLSYPPDHVLWLRSTKDVQDFLVQLERNTSTTMHSYQTFSPSPAHTNSVPRPHAWSQRSPIGQR